MAVVEQLLAQFDLVVRAEVLDFETVYRPTIRGTLDTVFFSVGVLVLAKVAVSIFTSIILRRGLNFAMKPITPNIQRISPIAGFKRMFGRRTWVEVGLGVVRLIVWFTIVFITLYANFDDLFWLDRCNEDCMIKFTLYIFGILSAAAIVILMVSVLVEVPLQSMLYLSDQKMTDTEVKNEQKEQSGSKEVRRERQRIRDELASAAEHAGIDKANMLFFFGDRAVAIRYHPEHAPVPILAAKAGTDETSLELRNTVRSNGFRELCDQEIVELTFKTTPGVTVPEAAFEPLVRGMKEIFT